MADIKISQLGAAVAVVDADVIPATANGVTVKVPASVLKEYAIGGTDISSIGDGTPTGAISALKSVKIEKTDIAPIETSVASKAYAVGDQLYYNGMLYSVIAAIAQGETLVVDTNIELSDKVTEQIKALQGSADLVNADLQKEVTTRAALGAHNLLNHIATTQVIDGVTFTVNADKSITVNGTNNTDNDATFALESRLPSYPNQVSKLYSNGDYILDGCPNGGSVETFFMYVASTKNNSYYEYGIDTGNGLAFTINGDDYNADSAYLGIGITIGAHVTINNLTFYPMIRLATDTDPTYKPHAMTNRDITQALAGEVILSSSYTSVAANTFENTGKSFTLDSPALIVVTIPYYNASVKGIAITKTNSLGDAYIVKEAVSLSTGLQAIGILGAGTWTIFASYIAASKSNPIKVFKIPICSNFA